MALMAPRVTHYDDDAPVGTPENPSHEIVTLPNVLTFLRLVLTFVFLYLFVTGTQATERTVAVVVYAVAACTDWADGLLARATQTVSWAGKVLDPIVDRALLFTGVLGLALRGELPAWIAVLLVLRDVWLFCGGAVLQHFYRRKPVDVIYLGKVTTALLMTGFTLMMLGVPVLNGLSLVNVPWLPLLNDQPGCLGLLFIYPACVTSVITAAIYTYKAYQYMMESRAAGERL